jgi:hypothetical protein
LARVKIELKPQKIGPERLKIHLERPKIDPETPKIHSEIPKIESAFSKIESQRSKLDSETAKIQIQPSKIRYKTPSMRAIADRRSLNSLSRRPMPMAAMRTAFIASSAKVDSEKGSGKKARMPGKRAGGRDSCFTHASMTAPGTTSTQVGDGSPAGVAAR